MRERSTEFVKGRRVASGSGDASRALRTSRQGHLEPLQWPRFGRGDLVTCLRPVGVYSYAWVARATDRQA
jgi:hypothetical protein